jgi:menaquinone-dependent protoporphyrinogen oxidase
MNTLIAVASRHGSTREIADALAQHLRSFGTTAIVSNVHEATNLESYDAVIIGSAIYMGHWLPAAHKFVQSNRAILSTMPVWLFSSGPLGEDNPQPKDDPGHLADLMQVSGAREHHNFVGKLDRSGLGFGERLTVNVVKAPDGDFRDWDAIRNWAQSIALALATPAHSESSTKSSTNNNRTNVPSTVLG